MTFCGVLTGTNFFCPLSYFYDLSEWSYFVVLIKSIWLCLFSRCEETKSYCKHYNDVLVTLGYMAVLKSKRKLLSDIRRNVITIAIRGSYRGGGLCHGSQAEKLTHHESRIFKFTLKHRSRRMFF